MHRSILLILLAVAWFGIQPAAAGDAAVTAEIDAAIRTLNDAYAAGDQAKIESMVTADHVGVSSYSGAQTTAEQFETLPQLDATYFDYTPPQVTMLGPDVVLVTYYNSYEGSFAGKPLPTRIFVSQIWQRQSGKWLQQLYQETPVPVQ